MFHAHPTPHLQDFILRQRGVRTVALSGFLTNWCVAVTPRSAAAVGSRALAASRTALLAPPRPRAVHYILYCITVSSTASR